MADTTSRVGILMGSDRDGLNVNNAAAALDEFAIPNELHVMSAHRTPHLVADDATIAIERGLQVIIAGAAHLAGIVAAHTTLQVKP